jgi:hypothetical protein
MQIIKDQPLLMRSNLYLLRALSSRRSNVKTVSRQMPWLRAVQTILGTRNVTRFVFRTIGAQEALSRSAHLHNLSNSEFGALGHTLLLIWVWKPTWTFPKRQEM